MSESTAEMPLESEEGSKQTHTVLLYEQTAKVAETFWEWRDKVMTRFFAATAGVLVVAGWFFKEPELKAWVFAPFIVGACYSVISHLLDRVNTHVLRECYRIAKGLEGGLGDDGGIFTSIENIHYHRGSYYGVLRLVYLGTAVICMGLAIAAFVVLR